MHTGYHVRTWDKVFPIHVWICHMIVLLYFVNGQIIFHAVATIMEYVSNLCPLHEQPRR